MKIPLTIPFWLWDKIISRWWFWLVIVAICNTVVIVKIYKQLVVLDREVWSGGLYCCDEQDETKPCEGPLALRLAMLEQRVARIGNFVHLPDEQPQASEPATISTATPQGQDCTVELALQAEP
ncbi:hypothetical protein HY546_00325, partial [archaeon]|nr:hypothetical protein [archaeon]